MSTVIVLVMHGASPVDFPRQEAAEFFNLRARLKHVHGPERAALLRRHDELDAKMRAWPRTPQNDPFFAGSQELAGHLRHATGAEVIVGFNEFCGPSLDEALDSAARRAESVVVITPMVTRGGEHSEVDIPEAVRRAQDRHPGVRFRYVWPFDPAAIARFLASQIE